MLSNACWLRKLNILRGVQPPSPSAQADTSAAAREQAATADARIGDLSTRLESCESDLRQRTAELAEARAAGYAASARAAALDSQCAAQLIALDEARDDAATAAMRAAAAAASAELRHKETTVLLDEALAEGARLRAGEPRAQELCGDSLTASPSVHRRGVGGAARD